MAPTPPGPQASVCHPGASSGAFRSGRAPVMTERYPARQLDSARRDNRERNRGGPVRGSFFPIPHQGPRSSGQWPAAVLVKPADVVPGKGNRFHHRVDAKLRHEIPHVGADGIHGEVQLIRYSVSMRCAVRQAG
jgi:hypothetical protein